MSGAKEELTDHIVGVQNRLAANVPAITRANELTFCDFTYNPKNYSGQFAVSVDGVTLEGRWGSGWAMEMDGLGGPKLCRC
jgi:hypothetical protein